MIKQKQYISALILFILIVPFSLHSRSDDIEATLLNDSTIGYYQSTTCKISLFEFTLQIEKYRKIFTLITMTTLILIVLEKSRELTKLMILTLYQLEQILF